MDAIQSTTRFICSLLLLVVVIFSVYKIIDISYSKKLQAYVFTRSGTNYLSARDIDRQLDCLSKNIYYEAATEPFEGKVAVAQVTINRAKSGEFPNDLCQVVYQKNIFYNKVVCQFSWYCEQGSTIKPVHKELYRESQIVAKKVLLEGFELPGLKDAMYYHADYVNPHWKKQRILKIGRHIFYR